MAMLAGKYNSRYQVKREYVGVSGDVKPNDLDLPVGSTFYETDTERDYVYTGSYWRRHSKNVTMSLSDSSAVDAFGKLRVASPVTLFDDKNIHSRNEALWEEPLIGAVIVHGAVTGGPFVAGEIITGGTSGSVGNISAVNSIASTITYSVNHNDFIVGETITGGTSGATAAVISFDTGSHILYDRNTASVILQCGAIAGDQAVRQTHRYFPGIFGKSQEIFGTVNFGAAVSNVRKRWGYFDISNGLFVEQTISGISFVVRSKTTGAVIDTLIPQANWSVDKMDGGGPSGAALDFTKTQLIVIDFQWGGAGRIRFGFFYKGRLIYAHEQNYVNVVTSVYMSTLSLPLRAEVANTGGTVGVNTMRMICGTIVSNGGESMVGNGYTVSNDIVGRAVTATAAVPIIAVRVKSAHPNGGDNRIAAELYGMGIFCTGNNIHYELRRIHDPSSMTATWADVGNGSGLEFSVNIAAISGGRMNLVEEGYAAVSQGGKGSETLVAVTTRRDQYRYIMQNYNSTNSEVFAVFAQSLGGNATAYAHLTWIETE